MVLFIPWEVRIKKIESKLSVFFVPCIFMKTYFLHLLAKKKKTKEKGVCVWGRKKSLKMFNKTENGKFARNKLENSVFFRQGNSLLSASSLLCNVQTLDDLIQ